MKKKFLTAALLCCSLWVFSQSNNPQVIDLQDRMGLLSLLFDSRLFDPSGEVLWRPLNFSDALTANYSDDGYLHTQLDTLLYFTTYGISQAVAVFSTLHYENFFQYYFSNFFICSLWSAQNRSFRRSKCG